MKKNKNSSTQQIKAGKKTQSFSETSHFGLRTRKAEIL